MVSKCRYCKQANWLCTCTKNSLTWMYILSDLWMYRCGWMNTLGKLYNKIQCMYCPRYRNLFAMLRICEGFVGFFSGDCKTKPDQWLEYLFFLTKYNLFQLFCFISLPQYQLTHVLNAELHFQVTCTDRKQWFALRCWCAMFLCLFLPYN